MPTKVFLYRGRSSEAEADADANVEPSSGGEEEARESMEPSASPSSTSTPKSTSGADLDLLVVGAAATEEHPNNNTELSNNNDKLSPPSSSSEDGLRFVVSDNADNEDDAGRTPPVPVVPDTDGAAAAAAATPPSTNTPANDESSSGFIYTDSGADVLLSYHFLPYKKFMYHVFRNLGLHATREVESRVAEEVLHAFRKGGLEFVNNKRENEIKERRLVKSVDRSSCYEEVDNESALTKIRRDIFLRKEYAEKWLDPNAVILDSKRSITILEEQSESSPSVRKSARPVRVSRRKSDADDDDNVKLEGRPKRARTATSGAVKNEEVGKTSRTAVQRIKKEATKTVVGKNMPRSKTRNRKENIGASQSKVVDAHRKRMEELLKGLLDAPNTNYYEEESAWRFYNPKFPETNSKKDAQSEKLTELYYGGVAPPVLLVPVSPNDLPPLPPAPPLPPLPSTGFCEWSFDEESRVLLADFRISSRRTAEGAGGEGRCEIKIVREDEVYLFTMMERDDITVISQGLADEINPLLWSREYIEGIIGSVYHHKVRGFETMINEDGTRSEQTREKEGWYNMKFSDYFQYLDQRCAVKRRLLDATLLQKEFTFKDSDGNEKTVDVDNEALYMVDVDVVKLLPIAHENFQQKFKLPGILPGGSHCMMSAVNANGRPFMGPNLYLTPPASFTHFHQDGHGTVDSGHLCLSGYNEVVMLRRLTERHKCHAVQLLTGTSTFLGTLYGLPHRDGLKSQPGWPGNDAIEQCKRMGYCPSVFVLKPGQVVHINKGRLHAFRKMAPSKLPETDCHHNLRNTILSSKREPTEDICWSIAWDWMFKGMTSEGINREISSILECSRLNRQHDLQSLAIPETTLLFLAKNNIAEHTALSRPRTAILPFMANSPTCDRLAPDAMTVLRGILSSLQYVVKRHSSSVESCEKKSEETKLAKDSWRVSIDPKPNTWQDPSLFSLDPYGASDFFCKFCYEELSNVYMHCDGCEKLLSKDFNICSGCHAEGRYKVFHQMHPFEESTSSILNHTGNKVSLRQSQCPCRKGKQCAHCTYCTGCSCRCHQWFTVHYRFMGLRDELVMLEMAEKIVASDNISQYAETRARLLSLIPPSGAADIRTNANSR